MNKVHICNMSCLCPLQGEQEAKPSRDCSIVPDRAAFSHRQMHQQGGQGFFSVVWKQFKSVIYFFLLQVQADSVHGNWLPECTALLTYPQGRLRFRDHWAPVLLPITLLAVPAWRGLSAHPGLSDPWKNKESQWQVQLCSFLFYAFQAKPYMLTI